ncbi:HIT domain-containing protein [Aestuariirhabdus litorea]|uniref:HIT domain-containing protein n=1 Tax=Aestuariirhabdus litorea TaxID=2528527 RepID=A0A3P3VP21_9GAMM|nr:HIT domain-containing protein [Aestuariirhabdus litorea]RRJ84164.1 HIT domain-containing protein [Aestuariirhabdus litorea]RWW97384.1 HIT domain-containing protein [Endozoicomonadaceae bacterium GTF-13]
MDEYQLDPQLSRDTLRVGEFPLCSLLLMNDNHYPWFILVPRRAGVQEIYQLAEEDRQQLLWESCYVSEKLKDLYSADKMNLAALGNMVPQLHLHHVVRYKTDAAWPAPVWGAVKATPYTEQQLAETMQRLKLVFTDQFEFAG